MSAQEMQEIRVKGKAARIRGATWTHDQVLKLLEVWMQPDIYQGLMNEKKKQDIFKRMAAILATHGVNRTWSECRAKIKNLKADFRKAMEKKVAFRYFSEMRKIMNLDGSAATTATSAAVSSAAEYDGDGEEDEVEMRIKHSPIDRPGTSASFVSEGPSSTSPGEYITASPHGHSTSPYQQQQQDYQMEPDDEDDMEGVDVVDHDSSSRSSMVITHVVSNVIEPVTTVIMPSSTETAGQSREPVPEPIVEGHDRFPGISSHSRVGHHKILEDQQPIRLEFVVDESQNVVLQESTTPPVGDRNVVHATSTSFEGQSVVESTSPSPILQKRLSQVTAVTVTASPVKHSRPFTSTPRKVPPPQRKRKALFQDPPPAKLKKQMQPQTINEQTMETISNLLMDSSQCLLQELQDAEQRFILWEEEKRTEERRREETMFTKLLGAMSKLSSSLSSPTNSSGTEINNERRIHETQGGKDNTTFVKDFTDMSKKLNGLLTDEVKATEESVRQWELKMQRQESRHTEKLFAMIINAIKTPSEIT